MPTFSNFTEAPLWQLARQFCLEIRPLVKQLESRREFSLKNQFQTAAGSVLDNIAEGFDRGGNKEFIQFLAIAKGSAAEVNSQLYRIYDCGYLTKEELDKLNLSCIELRNKLGGFIRYLKNSQFKGIKYKLK
jgi:four helix bundle protein